MDQGQPSTSRAVQPNNPHFSDRIRNMLLQESESECDDDLEDFADSDDSDADRTYIPPQEDDFSDDSFNTESSDVDVNVDTHPEDVEVTAQVPVEAPEFYYGKTSRNGSVPGYKWSSKEPQRNVRTPARNIVRGSLPGLKGPARLLGNQPKKQRYGVFFLMIT
ncbi:hypothetical protein J6590_053855 [Homalodisca vitripennis]|nr:hypothetical protein J6590_053855 [Homalodisca vitripennis]